MKNLNKITNYLLVLTIGAFLGYYIFVFLEKSSNSASLKYDTLLELVSDYYYYDVDENKLTENAIESVLSELDPHSIYLSPSVQKSEQEQFDGSFVGIGIEFQILEDTITVVSPISNGPSERVGILAGDKIIRIEDSIAVGLNISDVVNLLRGDKGSKVSITIKRGFNSELINFTLEREEIKLETVDVSLILEKNIGYIKLSKFAATSYDEIKNSLYDLKSSGMEKLILDLRNNPGGYLDQSIKISDLFLADDQIIVSTKGKIDDFNEEYFSDIKSEFEDLPVIILINEGSASASEIVAGALKDNDRAILVGRRSFGKGLVQRTFLMKDGSSFRLTIAEYFTPSGKSIQKDYSDRELYYDSHAPDSLLGGIIPDVIVQNDSLPIPVLDVNRQNLYYYFVRYAIDKNILNIEKIGVKSLTDFVKQYMIDRSISNEFNKFVESKGVKGYNQNTYEHYTNKYLKAFIARELYKDLGWYSVMLDDDKDISEAVKNF